MMKAALHPAHILLTSLLGSLLGWVLLVSPAMAQTTNKATVKEIIVPESEQAESTKQKIEKKHKEWSSAVFDTAYRLDSMFGGRRVDEEVEKTWLRVRTDLQYSKDEGLELKPRLRAKLVLPNLKRQAKLVFSADESDDDENTSSNADITSESGKSSTSAAFRYLFRENDHFKLDLDLGLRGKSDGIRFYTRLRARNNFTSGRWFAQIADTLYNYSDTGWENELRLDLERKNERRGFMHLTSQLKNYEEIDGVFFDQTVSRVYSLGQERTLGFDWISNLKSEPDLELGEKQFNETRFQVRYRRKLLWDWLYVELMPTIAFPSKRDYNPELRGLIRADVIFGGYSFYE